MSFLCGVNDIQVKGKMVKGRVATTDKHPLKRAFPRGALSLWYHGGE
ncbi:MAG: hypothetical protein HY719_04285 [Planctomycetes bacterium]|nr:hypothetical protein [Planctomycetota bacterium]